MSWIRANNPEIDPAQLEAEVEKLLAERRVPAAAPASDVTPADGDELEHLYELLDHYAEALDEGALLARAGRGAFLLRPLLKIFRRLSRDQRIFNFLVLEVLREQRSRLSRRDER